MVTKNNIPIRNMAVQYNFVFDRRNDGHQLNNPYWEQWVQHAQAAGGQQARPTARTGRVWAPVNFKDTSKGAEFILNCTRGPLSIHNHRGQNQFIPQNLQTFHEPDQTVPTDLSLPENERDVQFTINGQFQPELQRNRIRPRSGCSPT